MPLLFLQLQATLLLGLSFGPDPRHRAPKMAPTNRLYHHKGDLNVVPRPLVAWLLLLLLLLLAAGPGEPALPPAQPLQRQALPKLKADRYEVSGAPSRDCENFFPAVKPMSAVTHIAAPS